MQKASHMFAGGCLGEMCISVYPFMLANWSIIEPYRMLIVTRVRTNRERSLALLVPKHLHTHPYRRTAIAKSGFQPSQRKNAWNSKHAAVITYRIHLNALIFYNPTTTKNKKITNIFYLLRDYEYK